MHSILLVLVIAILLVELIRAKRANKALVETVRISSSTADAFFRSLALHLSRVLKTDYASITELSPRGKRLRTLAMVADGEVVEDLEYEITNTPSERVLALSRCAIPDNVQSVFPLDRVAPSLGLRSYIGVALVDSAGVALGVMSVMDRRPFKNTRTANAILDIIAHRASAEMERRRSERMLQESESKSRAILRALPDLMFIHDRDGVILDYYAGDSSELYVPPEHFLGKEIQDILPADVSAAILRGVEETIESHAPASFDYSLRLQEEIHFYEARVVELDASRMLTVARNVTSGKRSEDALAETRRFTQRIAETIPNVLFVFDLIDHKNVYVNQRSAPVIGYSSEEVLLMGDQFLKLLHPDDLARLPRLNEEYSHWKDGEVFEHFFRVKHKNGEWRWIHRCSTVFTRTDDGRPKQLLGSATDITALKTAEEELRLLSTRLLNAQDEERRRIARELHDGTAQNLCALRLNIAGLQQGRDLPAYVRNGLRDCEKLCEESLKEVRTISYLLHPPALDEQGLVASLSWFVEGFQRRSSIRVELEVGDAVKRLPSALELDLFRIVQEGLTNVARHSQSQKAVVRLHQDSNQVILQVRDFGHGMRLSAVGKPAAGVGISGMRERVRQGGGRLEIKSDDQGTTVTVIMPLPAKSTGPPSPEGLRGEAAPG